MPILLVISLPPVETPGQGTFSIVNQNIRPLMCMSAASKALLILIDRQDFQY